MTDPRPRIILGNKNYSSWSFRAWLVLDHAVGAGNYDETVVWLDTPTARDEKLEWAPVARVPILARGEQRVWDSLAICETLAEEHPSLWPADAVARARARSLVAEMHAGFADLRRQMPMNIRRERARSAVEAGVQADIDRVLQIWSENRGAGPFLFGSFTIADAFFAPVLSRFDSYEVAVPSGRAAEWADAMRAHDGWRRWCEAARAETVTMPYDDLD